MDPALVISGTQLHDMHASAASPLAIALGAGGTAAHDSYVPSWAVLADASTLDDCSFAAASDRETKLMDADQSKSDRPSQGTVESTPAALSTSDNTGGSGRHGQVNKVAVLKLGKRQNSSTGSPCNPGTPVQLSMDAGEPTLGSKSSAKQGSGGAAGGSDGLDHAERGLSKDKLLRQGSNPAVPSGSRFTNSEGKATQGELAIWQLSSLNSGSKDASGGSIRGNCYQRLWIASTSDWRKSWSIMRKQPKVLILPLIVLLLVLGFGLWAVLASADTEARTRKERAIQTAQDKALYIATELDKTFLPVYVVSLTIKKNPIYPQQNATELAQYANKMYLIDDNFLVLADQLMRLTRASTVRTVAIIPNGFIRTMYPLRGYSSANDTNWGAVGKNWLDDPPNADFIKLLLSSRNLTIIGPYNLIQGGIGIVGMQAVFVNAPENETFNVYDGITNVTTNATGGGAPRSPIPGMLELIQYGKNKKYPKEPKFWGMSSVLVSWDELRDNVTRLQDLPDSGLSYVLTRPATLEPNSRELAVAWSSDVYPPLPPNGKLEVTGVHLDLQTRLKDPMIAKVQLLNAEWTLYVAREWTPSWKWPLVAMVVILAFVFSLLVLVVTVSRALQRQLLQEVLDAARLLAQTTTTLEEEKNRMQALLARHLDLIDLLEGDKVDKSTFHTHQIDAMRQKLLGSSMMRRDDLSEKEQLTFAELLGEGTFGKVYKGLWRGTEVAIKTIVLPAGMSGKEKREKMAVMEAAISSSLAHPNIVTTYTYHIRPLRDSAARAAHSITASAIVVGGGGTTLAATDPLQAYKEELAEQAAQGIHSYEIQLVLEFCDRGCLRDVLDAGVLFGAGGLNYHAILDTAADVAKAMLHLHLNDVLHGDLKATNVMLKSVGDLGRGVVAKVADFGLSMKIDHAATHVSRTFQGTMTHMAPEVMLHGQVSKAADVYAFGITLWEIFTSGLPYKGTPGALLPHQVSKEGRRPIFPLGTPAGYRELAERCWALAVADRPAFQEVLDTLMKLRKDLDAATPRLSFPDASTLNKTKKGKLAAAAAASTSKTVEDADGMNMIGLGGLIKVGSMNDSTLGGSSSGFGGLGKLGGSASAVVHVGGRAVNLNALLSGKSFMGAGAGLLALETIKEEKDATADQSLSAQASLTDAEGADETVATKPAEKESQDS